MRDRIALKSTSPSSSSRGAERQDRSAAALRANLKRRKAQARDRREQDEDKPEAAGGDPLYDATIAAEADSRD